MTASSTKSALTVFLPNYNHARFLPKALDALLAQTVRPDKICILDDGSTDDSRAVIEAYCARYPELFEPTFLPQNRGLMPNVTEWLAQASGEFLFFAAADDVPMPTLFEEALTMLRQHPEAGLCSALSRVIDETGADMGLFQVPVPSAQARYIAPAEASRLLIEKDAWFMGNTVVYRRTALQAIGFEHKLGSFSDGFACRVLALSRGVCFIPRELSFWRRMTSNMSMQALVNVEEIQRVAQRATELMNGRYAEIFPPRYVQRWRRRWFFCAIAAQFSRPGEQTRGKLADLLVSFPPFVRNLLQGLNELPVGNRIVGPLAAFLCLRPFDILPASQRTWRRLFM